MSESEGLTRRDLLATVGATGLAAVALGVSAAGPAEGGEEKVDRGGFVSTQGRNFSRDGRVIRLRGFNFNNEHGLYLTEVYVGKDALARGMPELTEGDADYARIKGWGANLVRWGMDWHWFNNPDPTVVRKAWATMDRAVAQAKRHGLLLLPVMFVPEGGYMGYSGNRLFWGGDKWTGPNGMTPQQRSLVDLWVKVARRYANEPAVLGYDLLNEPSSYDLAGSWAPYACYLIERIREVDPKHLIVFESQSDSRLWEALPLREPIKYRDIVYSVHHYAPLAMTHAPRGDYAYPGDAPDHDGKKLDWDKASMAERMPDRLSINFGKRAKVPMLVGEFGCKPATKGYVQYISDQIELMESWDVGWCFFVYREWDASHFGLYHGPKTVPSADPTIGVHAALLSMLKRHLSHPSK